MMKSYDRGSSLFWLLLSIFICTQSLRMGIGTPRHPGMGFMTFGSSVLLGIFSMVIFIQTFLKEEASGAGPILSNIGWKRVIFVVIALLFYSKFLSFLGYLIATFLLMAFLFWVTKGMRWLWILGSSCLVTVLSYIVFSKWLNCQFPEGLFGL